MQETLLFYFFKVTNYLKKIMLRNEGYENKTNYFCCRIHFIKASIKYYRELTEKYRANSNVSFKSKENKNVHKKQNNIYDKSMSKLCSNNK